jgi:hypothetical protein
MKTSSHTGAAQAMVRKSFKKGAEVAMSAIAY